MSRSGRVSRARRRGSSPTPEPARDLGRHEAPDVANAPRRQLAAPRTVEDRVTAERAERRDLLRRHQISPVSLEHPRRRRPALEREDVLLRVADRRPSRRGTSNPSRCARQKKASLPCRQRRRSRRRDKSRGTCRNAGAACSPCPSIQASLRSSCGRKVQGAGHSNWARNSPGRRRGESGGAPGDGDVLPLTRADPPRNQSRASGASAGDDKKFTASALVPRHAGPISGSGSRDRPSAAEQAAEGDGILPASAPGPSPPGSRTGGAASRAARKNSSLGFCHPARRTDVRDRPRPRPLAAAQAALGDRVLLSCSPGPSPFQLRTRGVLSSPLRGQDCLVSRASRPSGIR